MPTITKRNDTYKITVSAGYDINGKQIRRYMTWRPPSEMTLKQAEKEVKKQAILFEERVRNGTYLDGSIKFADFAEQWFNDYAKEHLRATTYKRYKSMLPRINKAIGHMKLEKIQPQHLLSFYKNLAEEGIREDIKYKACCDLHVLIKDKKLTFGRIAEIADIGERTVSAAVNGQNVTEKTALAICGALSESIENVFTIVDEGKTLSSSTIHYYHNVISSMLTTAVQWQIIFSNPCDRVKPPKVGKPEPKYLDKEQAKHLIDCLQDEGVQFRVMIERLMFTGLRRGELLGLEWSDIDFENKSFSDTAKDLNVSVNYVYTLRTNAVRDLRRDWRLYKAIMKEEHYDDSISYRYSAGCFKNSGLSSVEVVAIRNEREQKCS